MTELETHLLNALQKLQKESSKLHKEYMNSANELQQMFEDTKKKNDEIETLLKDLTTQLNRS